jgi:oligopeptide transport system ATP-binding protein
MDGHAARRAHGVGGTALPPTPVLDVRNVTVDFRSRGGTFRAVDDVSLSIGPGETVALVGESGSGKSVTSLAIMGLLPPAATVTAGSIRFRQRSGAVIDLLTLSGRAWAELRGDQMAMVFQEPMSSLNPLHTVGDQIVEALRLHRRTTRAEAVARGVEMLGHVGIPEPHRRLASYPHELSGGMRQRVMIAMGLICDPLLLIADEPTTALDVTIQAQIIELFRSVRNSFQQALLFITHDFGVVADLAERVYVMYAGQVVESGDVRTILTKPLHPYTKGLIASLPRIDRPVRGHERLRTIAGKSPDRGEIFAGCRFAPRCAWARQGVCAKAPVPLRTVTDGHEARCLLVTEIGGLNE